MTVMNRLSPLIVRRDAPAVGGRRGTTASSAAIRWHDQGTLDGAEPGKWLDELKLFATGWIGGLIFFGTYLG